MKIAICDDEQAIRDYIEKCILEVNLDVSVQKYSNAEPILSTKFDADILFLDIQMPGVDGMKAARILRTMGKKTIIVFVTAVEECVFEAFDVGATQYIVKPFEKNKIIETIKKVLDLAKEQRMVEKVLNDSNAEEDGLRSFIIKSGGVTTRVLLVDISYAEVFDRRMVLHTKDKEKIEYYGKMSDLEKIAGPDFFRVHRAYLLNLAYVENYDSKFVTIMGESLPVARGKYQELVKAYLSYHTRKEHL